MPVANPGAVRTRRTSSIGLRPPAMTRDSHRTNRNAGSGARGSSNHHQDTGSDIARTTGNSTHSTAEPSSRAPSGSTSRRRRPRRGLVRGISRAASSIATTPIGTFTRNTTRQPCSSPKSAMIRPPRTGPVAADTPTVVPNQPNARARSAPWNSSWIRPVFCGVSIPAATPCSSRAATRSSAVGAAPATALVSVKPVSPARNIRRRPTRSPRRPPATSTSPKVRA
jgi:hypothetical protein